MSNTMLYDPERRMEGGDAGRDEGERGDALLRQFPGPSLDSRNCRTERGGERGEGFSNLEGSNPGYYLDAQLCEMDQLIRV
jgi:hypothetical protein